MDKYKNLVNVLDQLRYEAPKEIKKYHPDREDLEKVNQARSRALIHLYLKVSFGLLDFKARERLVTDGSYDGGIDAYYIDHDERKVYIIQSKFRTNSDNFENIEISLEELLKMDVDRITDGETQDEDGNEYNGKIKQFQREILNAFEKTKYTYEVVILANLKGYKNSHLRRLTGGVATTVFDNKLVYNKLLFPVITGTYYNNQLLSITLNLTNNHSSNSRISYNVETEYKDCDITVLFVPTREIGRILNSYKNSILKYNPRCYLEMKANSVNREINETITQKKSNEFALFNNGITMLSDETSLSERVGKKDTAKMLISNPQIINGGQTAFTLSRIYQQMLDGELPDNIFDDKEVLLKVITFGQDVTSEEEKKRSLIESISKATNRQSEVSDADRRSNDKIQIDLQEIFFEKFGLFYERKKGEFSDGLKEKYLHRDQIIDRELLLRLAISCDRQPSIARRSSAKQIFKESNFNSFLNDQNRSSEYIYAYETYRFLNNLEKELKLDKGDPFGSSAYGQAIRFGRFAVVSVCVNKYFVDDASLKDVAKNAKEILSKWLKFESFAEQKLTNISYFRVYEDLEEGITKRDLNYDGYYKGRTINQDLVEFFNLSS